jgi:hypothetical protein
VLDHLRRDLEASAEVDQRVPGHDRPPGLEPEHEIVVGPPREYLDADRQPVAGRVQVRLAAASRQQPRQVGALPPLRELRRIDPVLPHEVVGRVRRRRVHRRAEGRDEGLRIALVPGRGEHDRRLTLGGELEELPRHGQRIEEQQPRAVVDRIGRHLLRPPLIRRPVGMRSPPVPEACPKLVHAVMLRAPR